ncbi:MAG: hypothetical protein HDR98_00780 [Bacteroides sp.]|nr:hypothetical protein [Bacteroides sp.]
MIKKLFIYASALLALTACSDEDFSIPGSVDSNGIVTMNLSVADMTTVPTRAADPDAVKDLTILVLDDNGSIAQVVPFTGSEMPEFNNGSAVITFTLDKELRGKVNTLTLAAVANNKAVNTGIEFAVNDDYAEKSSTSFEFNPTTSDYITMTGDVKLSDVINGDASCIPLYRTVAKVSAMMATETDGKYTEGDVLNSGVFGAAEDVRLDRVPCNGKFILPADNSTLSAGGELVNPTSKDSDRAYVIVQAPYDGSDYYYRVNFEKIEGEGATQKVVPMSVEANHEYKVYVIEVKDKGYATPAEAAKNPVSKLETEIIDVYPQSYNMITDGIRELGVSDVVIFDGSNSTTADNWDQTKSFYVKLYTPNDEEYKFEAANIDIECDWLEVVKVNPPVAGSNPDINAGQSFHGKAYEVMLKLKETKEPGTLETNITIRWQGLTRPVKVVYARDFSASDLISSAKLLMKDGTGAIQVTVDDYFAFLGGNATGGMRLYGVATGETGDSIRNEGLHFPVMYGEDGARWTYEYQLSYKAPIEGEAYQWEFDTPLIYSDNGGRQMTDITVSPKNGTAAAGEGITVTVTCSNTDYNYQVGQLRLKVTSANLAKPIYLPIDIYHTGFFHRTNTKYLEKSASTAQNNEFCYYEVLKSKVGKFWLDRNLGAHTNQMYIETSSGSAYFPENQKLNGGEYYHGCHWGEQLTNDYTQAQAYTDLCPPGWDIPNKATWATLRSNSDFRTSQIGSYYDASLAMEGGRRIYFPKVGYYEGTSRRGTSRAGYYWTTTPADGLEKEEIMKWMQIFVLEGTNPSFERASADESASNLSGASMSVRCIHKSSMVTEQQYRTYFNVSGATHVYLYTEVDGNRTAATNWPGQAIGNWQTMTMNMDDPLLGQQFYLDYTSATAKPQDLYVIFNYVDEHGQIHTMSRRTMYGNTDSSVRHTIGTSPTQLYGWKVVGDSYDGKTTGLGGHWGFAFDDTNNVVGAYNTTPTKAKTYKIQWNPAPNNLWQIALEDASGRNIIPWSSYDGAWSTPLTYTLTSVPSGYFIVKFRDGTEGKQDKIYYYKDAVRIYDFTGTDDIKTLNVGSNITEAKPSLGQTMNVYFYDFAGWGTLKVKYSTPEEPTLQLYNLEDSNSVITRTPNTDNMGYVVKIPANCVQLIFCKTSGGSDINVPQTSIKSGQIYCNISGKEIPTSGFNRIVVRDNNIYNGETTKGRGVYIYYWGASKNDWPGTKMEPIGGSNIYCYDFQAPNFIINNGVKDNEGSPLEKRQTKDKTYSDDFTKGAFFEAYKE